jgi:quinoprotein glucose dehydrogenase
LRKIFRRILIGVLVVPILVWLGVSAGVKLTVAKEVPFSTLLGLVGSGLFSPVVCVVIGCESELLEGMENVTFDESLLESTPVALDIDEFGRVLVAETGRQNHGAEDNREHDYWLIDDLASRTVEDRRAYYQKWIDAGEVADADHFTAQSDRLVILEDTDGDGVADSRKELATWDEMASGLVAGVESREGTIWVTSIPSVYRIEDDNHDGEAESVVALQTGFGVKTSLIGHDLHGLVWGPDGKLYFSMGDRGYHVTLPAGRVLEPSMGPGRGAVFRMNADGSDLEVFATGVRNPQELAFDAHGNLFTGDNNGDGGDSARIVYLVEGGETGWAMPYQSLVGDYIRGPWVSERLWDLQHESQPAWVLPPVAHIANGPAGFVHYPGLGLPERYADHFFLCDYAYTNGRSGIWSFALEPRGAGFEMVDRHKFAWSVLATDFDFSWDGRMFATLFDQIGLRQKIETWQHPESRADPRVEELERLARGRMGERESAELLGLLSFPDQRIRLRAQYALAEREEISGLARLAQNADAPLVARLHALWGLGQIGSEGVRAIAPQDFAWATRESEEFRAQLNRLAGTARAEWLVPALREALAEESPRLRFFAAQSLGALRDRSSVDPLVRVIRENADADVFLRHAAVWALHRIGDLEAIWAYRDDADRSVRLAVLLVLRQSGDPRIETFLRDADPLLVVEAARAIYDWPIDAAMPSLAALSERIEPASEEDLQTGQALHRRVIGANVRVRSEAGARALAEYARDESQLESLRRIAMEALGSYSSPPQRDLTMGFYRPLPDADPEILASVFRSAGRELIDSSLGSRAMEIANQIGELPLDDEELVELAKGAGTPPAEGASALRALAMRADSRAAKGATAEVAQWAFSSPHPEMRSAALDLLWAVEPGSGLARALEVVELGPTSRERQHAWERLGGSEDDRAATRIDQALTDWSAGQLDTAVALDVLEAAQAQGGGLAIRAQGILAGTAEVSGVGPVEIRRWALEGGDAKAGQRVFQTIGDCQRCHGGGGGHGGGAGPELAGVKSKGAEYVLESVLVPEAQIAEGFGSIVVTRKDGSKVSGLLLSADASRVRIDTGGSDPLLIEASEIEAQSEPTSGMPPMGLALAPHALRDVIAYVLTLE